MHGRPIARWTLAILFAIAAAFGLAACGSNPSSPTTVVTPPPPPPPPPATPPPAAPTITSVTASSPRVEADAQVQVTAVVENGDFAPEKLTWAWSATPASGTFTGTSAAVSWQAPHLERTPDTYTLTLDIKAPYTNGGTAKEYDVSSSVQVHYNDSNREITSLSDQFFSDFTNYSVSPEECVRNFSDSCSGREDELSDITRNRIDVHILGGTWFLSNISYDGPRENATVTLPCTFYNVGSMATGTCTLTAIYQNWQWYLCSSTFGGTATTTSGVKIPSSLARYMHP